MYSTRVRSGSKRLSCTLPSRPVFEIVQLGPSQLLRRSIGRDVEHVFQPVGTFRNLLTDIIDAGVGAATAPVGAEAEDLAVEMVLCVGVLHDEAGVDHAPRGCGCGHGGRHGLPL